MCIFGHVQILPPPCTHLYALVLTPPPTPHPPPPKIVSPFRVQCATGFMMPVLVTFVSIHCRENRMVP